MSNVVRAAGTSAASAQLYHTKKSPEALVWSPNIWLGYFLPEMAAMVAAESSLMPGPIELVIEMALT